MKNNKGLSKILDEFKEKFITNRREDGKLYDDIEYQNPTLRDNDVIDFLTTSIKQAFKDKDEEIKKLVIEVGRLCGIIAFCNMGLHISDAEKKVDEMYKKSQEEWLKN